MLSIQRQQNHHDGLLTVLWCQGVQHLAGRPLSCMCMSSGSHCLFEHRRRSVASDDLVTCRLFKGSQARVCCGHFLRFPWNLQNGLNIENLELLQPLLSRPSTILNLHLRQTAL